MQIHIPPTDAERNQAAIQRAIDSKQREVDEARRKLTDLQAELRGLTLALKAIGGPSEVPHV